MEIICVCVCVCGLGKRIDLKQQPVVLPVSDLEPSVLHFQRFSLLKKADFLLLEKNSHFFPDHPWMFPQSPTKEIRWDQSLSFHTQSCVTRRSNCFFLFVCFCIQLTTFPYHLCCSSLPFLSVHVFPQLQGSLIDAPLSPAHKDAHSSKLVTWRCKSRHRR